MVHDKSVFLRVVPWWVTSLPSCMNSEARRQRHASIEGQMPFFRLEGQQLSCNGPSMLSYHGAAFPASPAHPAHCSLSSHTKPLSTKVSPLYRASVLWPLTSPCVQTHDKHAALLCPVPFTLPRDVFL